MSTRVIHALRILLSGTLVLFLAGYASWQAPKAHAVTSGCAPYAILASRGSGQLMDDSSTNGFGQPVFSFIESFLAELPAGTAAATTTWNNPYLAVPVSWPHLLNAASAALNSSFYSNSVNGGQNKLTAAITNITATCAGSTKIILVGYSQGAQVTANVYQALAPDLQADISGVALFGDPLFNPGSPGDMGDFSGDRQGLLAHPSSRMRPAFADDGKVLSYCFQADVICQGPWASFFPLQVSGLAAHSAYNTDGDADSTVPYSTRAALYFANLTGIPSGSAAPSAMITPVDTAFVGRPITISAAESTDPDGEELTYSWDLANSGTFSTASPSRTTSTVFKTAGTYTVRLQVTNESGLSATASAVVTVVADPDPGTLQAPTTLAVEESSDGLSDTLTWQPPASGPAPGGYEVFGGDGTPLAATVGGGPGSLTLPAGGVPSSIDVESVDSDGEGGILTAQFTPEPSAIATVNGPTASVAAQIGEGATISFAVQAGQAFYINGNLSQSDQPLEANYDLLDPSGITVLEQNDDSVDAGSSINVSPIVATTSGIYTLNYSLENPLGNPGSGIFSAQVFGTDLTASQTIDGAPVTVNVPASDPGDWSVITFAASAGQEIYINGTSTFGTSTLEVSIFDPSGKMIYDGIPYFGVWSNIIAPMAVKTSGV
ncbi:cutinase family protein [Streptacidiphilus sp. P02-A3a]|uniref:cutinase family protein n=1 Tax=Streptacidiphilus sp. P02-A3a TaxID=2704468 RepID=UPI0015FB12D8|nr:cutinase family protein [Streptacidiphilus sp. P02-A3a]QMU67589.1 cutinase family protein [Streptacidiphilus sp. P02-A3a]